MDRTNTQIVLDSRPHGKLRKENFRTVKTPLPALQAGQVLVRVDYVSVDPYMRGRLDDAKSYVAPYTIGEVVGGASVGEVIESTHPAYRAGDKVTGNFAWQAFSVSDGQDIRKVDAANVPLTAYLGAAGMPGVTAWYGLWEICKPLPGQTLVVSAAAGAVGSVAGQLAKLAGARVIGIAGGPEKCKHVVQDLGFDACVDYKAGQLERDLERAAPNGVDCIFENVAGQVLDAALTRVNNFARVAICGLIAGYEGEETPLQRMRTILINRVTMRGFIITDHPEIWPHALSDLAGHIASGKLQFRETVTDGLENAPDALIGLLSGRNLGKQLIRVRH